MDWGKYGEYKDLFKHMEKCTDLIRGYSVALIDTKQPLSKKLNFHADKFAFEEKSFFQAVIGKADEGKFLPYKLEGIKKAGLFNEAMSVISKMTQQSYESALQKLNDIKERGVVEPTFNTDTQFYNPVLKSVNRDGYTNIGEYPPTVEQFKNESISLLISHGITLDMAEVAKEKTIGQSLKSMWNTTKMGASLNRSINIEATKVLVGQITSRF